MKISALIEYLAQYLREHGDVNLDVEFAGAPKTPPPETQIPIIPLSQLPDIISKFEKIIKSWPEHKINPNYDVDDYKKFIKYWDPPPIKYWDPPPLCRLSNTDT